MTTPRSSPALPIAAGAILDDVRAFLAVLSLDGTIQYVNASVARRSATGVDDIVGRSFATVRWWTYIPGVSAQVERALGEARAGRRCHVELEAQMTPSQRVIFDFEIRPAFDTSGNVAAIVAEGHDVTEQRTAERKFRDVQFYWRTIADFTVDWEIWLHPNGHVLYASPSCQALTGYSPDDFVQGKVTLAGIAHAADRDRLVNILTRAFAGSTDHHQFWRLLRRDGVVRWVSMSWTSVRDENGSFKGVRGSIRDVTDLIRAQEELQRSVEAYRTLARHFPKGLVALLDRDLKIVVCDGPAFEAVSIDADRVVGRQLFDVLTKEMRVHLEPMIASAAAGNEIADIVQFRGVGWLVHLTPIHDQQRHVAHIIASAVESQ